MIPLMNEMIRFALILLVIGTGAFCYAFYILWVGWNITPARQRVMTCIMAGLVSACGVLAWVSAYQLITL